MSVALNDSFAPTRAPGVLGDPLPTNLALDGLPEMMGFHLRLAYVALYRSFAATLGDLHLTQKQVAVLRLISANPGVAQVDIGGVLGMDRASTMAVVDRLQQRGFIVRKRCLSDRRRQELYLTDGGVKVLREAKKAIVEHEGRFAERFGEAELAQVIEALRRIHGQPF
ncbi:MAG: MarR family transcriptional regulator [Caulobacteraceae bacterium]